MMINQRTRNSNKPNFKKGFIEGLKNDYEYFLFIKRKWQAIEEAQRP
jgi:hypothetical protein